jgi:hypothetical protein
MNPDGSVDAVHEFKNSLSSNGKNILRALIAGETKVERHFITPSRYDGVGGEGPRFECEEGIGGRVSSIYENSSTMEATVTTDLSVFPPPLILTAICTASEVEEGSVIQSVYTKIDIETEFQGNKWPRLYDFVANPPFLGYHLTNHHFASDEVIPVVLNQQYAFNVVISFS